MGVGRKVQEGGDTCIHIVDSLDCTAETHTIFYSNYISNKNKINKNPLCGYMTVFLSFHLLMDI